MNKELQRAKDEAARKAGYENYSHMIKTLGHHRIGETTDTVFDYVINRAMEIYAEKHSKHFAEWIAQNCRMYENEFSLYNLNKDVLEIRPISELYELFNLFKTTKP